MVTKEMSLKRTYIILDFLYKEKIHRKCLLEKMIRQDIIKLCFKSTRHINKII